MIDAELLDSYLYIIQGLVITMQYTVVSVSLGLILGGMLAMCKLSSYRFLKLFGDVYTSIFRGTPLLVQLSIVYYGLPTVIGLKIPMFVAGVLAFSLNSTAYVSEVIRAGVKAVDKGQFEAAAALGLSHRQMMKDIILPQAIRHMLPSLVNELIDMLKESSLISIIGGADVMRRAQMVSAEQFTFFGPLLVAAGCYYVIVMILALLAKWLERRLAL